ncbi:MAG TPA: tetratricopeptide repeat protein [Vicinamibacterales bacterium]|nr:tetratricopeptide repeat protein [Vicinamibacterales bacterium]
MTQRGMHTGTATARFGDDDQPVDLRAGYVEWVLRPLNRGAAIDVGAGYEPLCPLDDPALRYAVPDMVDALDGLVDGDEVDGDDQGVRIVRARAHLARVGGALESAETLLRRGLGLAPDHPDLLHDFVLNLKDQGRLQEAEDACRRAVERHPASTSLHLDMAAVLANRAHLEAAAEFAKVATMLSPESAAAWLALGNLRYLIRALGGAREAFDRFRTLAPADPVGPLMLGLALILDYRDAEAIEPLREAYRLVEAEPGLVSAVASHLCARFSGDAAVHDGLSLLKTYGERAAQVLARLTDALLNAGRLEEAVRAATAQVVSTPESGLAHYQLGIACYLQRDYARAVPPLRRAACLLSGDVRPAFLLASCLWHQGKQEEAVQACGRSVVWFASSVPRSPLPNHAHAAEGAGTLVTLPWNMPMYRFSGLFHPLISEVTHERFEGFSLEYPVARTGMTGLRSAYLRVLEHFAATRDWLESRCPDVGPGRLFAFLESRHFLSQILADQPGHEFSVLHTAPHTLNQTPWLLHVEIPATLFYPFVSYGKTRDLVFEDMPSYRLVKAYLESDCCLGIFSHLKATCDALPRLFHNPALAGKVHYFPLSAPAVASSTVSRPSESGGPIRILFTGSFNDDTWSFYSRGGLYVAEAFLTLAEEFPDLELVLRVNLPKTLEADLLDRILRHPRISIVTQRLSEHELQALYDSADIMALPSYTLHCQSVFRAMASGCVCVVSDAPDYGPFARDGENCVVAAGRLGTVYDVDPDLGIVREHYPNMRLFDRTYAASVTAAFRRLVTDRDLLRTLRATARTFVATEYPRVRTVGAFSRILSIARSRANVRRDGGQAHLGEGVA